MEVLIIGPKIAGGMQRLFEHLMQLPSSNNKVKMTFFDSIDYRQFPHVQLPYFLARFLFRLLRTDFDICHINLAAYGSTPRKMLFAIVARLAGVPYIIHLHGGAYRTFFVSLPGALKWIVQAFFRHSERVIVLGTVWRDFVVDEIGVDPSKTNILPNAVYGPKELVAKQSDKPPHLLFLGRLGSGKGTPEIIEALATPELKALSWHATLAGDGIVEETREAVSAAGLQNHISVPGWVGPGEVEGLLGCADVLMLPSHVENLPLSMLEGMGYGLCPVVTPVGAVPDVIRDGENGLLVPVGDSGALAVALARVIADEEFRQKLGAAARRDFEAHYDIRHYREKLEAIYLDVLKDA